MNFKIENKHNVAYFNNYKFYLKVEKGLSDNTIYSYLSDIAQFFDHNSQNIEFLTNTDIINYLVTLQEIGLSFKSIARKHSVLKSFFLFLIDEEVTVDIDFQLIPSIKPSKKLPESLSHNEVFRLLDDLPLETPLQYRNKAMLELMYATGMRISEVINLNIHDVLFDVNMVKVIGKGSKQRYVPFAGEAAEFMQVYINRYRNTLRKGIDTDCVFLNRSGKKLSRMGIWKVLKKAAFDCGLLKRVYPHIIRHSFATHLIDGGANLRTVQMLLGHSSINTTQVYTNIDMQHILEEHRKFHPRG